MTFLPIFTDENTCNLWEVCFSEHQVDEEDRGVFTLLFDEKWTDVEYIREFLKTNSKDLYTPFWNGLSISDAIDKIDHEREAFDTELYSIETKQPRYENASLVNVFEKLHDNIYALTTRNENHRKGKPDVSKPLLRIYAIELDDGTYIVTGGTIKLKKDMIGDNFDAEFKQLKRVQDFLKAEGITDRQGLIQK